MTFVIERIDFSISTDLKGRYKGKSAIINGPSRQLKRIYSVTYNSVTAPNALAPNARIILYNRYMEHNITIWDERVSGSVFRMPRTAVCGTNGLPLTFNGSQEIVEPFYIIVGEFTLEVHDGGKNRSGYVSVVCETQVIKPS